MPHSHPTIQATLLAFYVLIWASVPLSSAGEEYLEVLPKPPFGNRRIVTRKFAKIPDFNGEPARIVGITGRWGSLYVCTSVSGGVIHRVTSTGGVRAWFNVEAAMEMMGREVEMRNPYHGGIRSIAFHPGYTQNGRFYVSLLEERKGPPEKYNYLSRPPNQKDADSVVYEWRVNVTTRRPIPTSMREVIRVGIREYDHPIKQMAFKGPYLYIAHGDGSLQSAEFGGGLKDDGLGKIIRINPLPKNSKPYSIPASNPFVRNVNYKPELFAVGFRNPHNICFSRKKGDLFVADSGRDNVEEINIANAGRSYGWPEREGPFVHRKAGGGLGNGVSELPKYDEKFGFTYPNAAIGHFGNRGWSFNEAAQAIAASCPVENGSNLNGLLLYCNFPSDGALYYSGLTDLREAVVKGPPSELRMAKSYRMRIFYNYNVNNGTKLQEMEDLREIVRTDIGRSNEYRADVRFGRGSGGELYWSSKSTGWIYIISNSLPNLPKKSNSVPKRKTK